MHLVKNRIQLRPKDGGDNLSMADNHKRRRHYNKSRNKNEHFLGAEGKIVELIINKC